MHDVTAELTIWQIQAGQVHPEVHNLTVGTVSLPKQCYQPVFNHLMLVVCPQCLLKAD